MANYYDENGNLSEQEPGPDWNAGMRPPLSGAPTNPYAGDLPPGPARDGYQWVKNPTTGEWEEHSTVPDVPDNPADRPPGSSMPPVTPPVIPPGTGTTGGTPAEIEAQGRAYDRANGLVGGYMRNGVWVNGSPSGGGNTRPGGTDFGGAAGLGGSPAFQGQYNFPSLSLDRVSYEDFVPGAKFDRGDPFAAPDPASIQNDPSYQWRYDQGLATQKRKGANSGTFFGGATMKALQGWGQNYASNEYKDIYSRAADVYDRNLSGKFNEWKSNEDQRFNSWNANRGLAFDTVNTNNAAKTNEFAPQQRWAELTFGRDFDLYKYMNDDAFRYSDLDARIKMAQAAAGRETP